MKTAFKAHVVAWRRPMSNDEMLFGPQRRLNVREWNRVIWNSAARVRLAGEATLLGFDTFDTIAFIVWSDEPYSGIVCFDDIRAYLVG